MLGKEKHVCVDFIYTHTYAVEIRVTMKNIHMRYKHVLIAEI